MEKKTAHNLWIAAEQCTAILSQAQIEIKDDLSEEEWQKTAKNLAKTFAALYEYIQDPLQIEHPTLKAHYLSGPNQVDREMLDEVAMICSIKRQQSIEDEC